jgi:hypothetical protein
MTPALIFGILGTLAVAAFIAGLLHSRYRAVPMAATVVVLVIDVVLVGVSIVYANASECEASGHCDFIRSVVVNAALATGALVGTAVIAIIWLGALFSRFLPRPSQERP